VIEIERVSRFEVQRVLTAFGPEPESIFTAKDVDMGLSLARSDDVAPDPKLGASFPPVVLVITRPWYPGATATWDVPDASVSSTTSVCCLRKAMSDSNCPPGAGAAVRSAAPQPAATRQMSRYHARMTADSNESVVYEAL
jgi:hypothetical protein